MVWLCGSRDESRPRINGAARQALPLRTRQTVHMPIHIRQRKENTQRNVSLKTCLLFTLSIMAANSAQNCHTLYYSLSHVLREFNHCYGFFANDALCSHLDEELKHCLLFYAINHDANNGIIKAIEQNLLKLNPVKYASMMLDSPSSNLMNPADSANKLLLTIIHLSSSRVLESASNLSAPIMNDTNFCTLMDLLKREDSMDALTLHSICHCIDDEIVTNAIHKSYLCRSHYDPYFVNPALSDKAVQFSTLRL